MLCSRSGAQGHGLEISAALRQGPLEQPRPFLQPGMAHLAAGLLASGLCFPRQSPGARCCCPLLLSLTIEQSPAQVVMICLGQGLPDSSPVSLGVVRNLLRLEAKLCPSFSVKVCKVQAALASLAPSPLPLFQCQPPGVPRPSLLHTQFLKAHFSQAQLGLVLGIFISVQLNLCVISAL